MDTLTAGELTRKALISGYRPDDCACGTTHLARSFAPDSLLCESLGALALPFKVLAVSGEIAALEGLLELC